MLFNSYEFIFVFLPITFFVYFYLNHKRLTEASKGFLVCSSLFFYSWWNVAYLPIILASMIFNYVIGRSLNKTCNNKGKGFSRKAILIFGVVLNLSLLGYFKYADFFIENINIAFSVNAESLNLLLPLAISFFTFQQIAYLVDNYRQGTEEYDFLNYALFVTFFPQLIAGPIVHHKEMMPQFAKTRNKVKNYRNIAIGLFIFSIGLFKKVVIADTFAVWATQGFDVATTLNLFEAWATSLSYTFQLYFDFSGYTDMAIGLALLFNIRLPVNFNSPYKATNIQDFWRRWHITLSRFLRDYVYIPLGGNRKGGFRTYNNLMATFVIGGLWHGAGWTFVFWGFLHGLALIIQKLWEKLGFKLWSWFAWLITFNFVNIAWVFFRAKEWDDAVRILTSMVNFDRVGNNLEIKTNFHIWSYLDDLHLTITSLVYSNTILLLTCLLATILFLVSSNNTNSIIKTFKPNVYHLFGFIALFLISLFKMTYLSGGDSEFLYFNF
jgi:alginate O-acetyltransferase complex protein AlgI